MPFLISNQDNYTAKLQTLRAGGAKQLQILADFDQTLTLAKVNGQSVRSTIAILRDNDKFLGAGYAQAAHALADHYIPLEQSPDLDPAAKSAAMLEWWEKHYELLQKSGLQRQHLTAVLESGWLKLRPLVPETMQLLAKHNIPLVILSANGLGQNIITLLLEKHGLLTPNVIIISNQLSFDQAGNFVGVVQPIIHSGNKAEISLGNPELLASLKQRRNILLLGDGLHDLDMAQGLPCQNLLSLGFYNQDDLSRLPEYQQAYDALITDDGDFGPVQQIIKELL